MGLWAFGEWKFSCGSGYPKELISASPNAYYMILIW